MAEIVATNVVASRPPNGDRLQRRPLVPIGRTYQKLNVYLLPCSFNTYFDTIFKLILKYKLLH